MQIDTIAQYFRNSTAPKPLYAVVRLTAGQFIDAAGDVRTWSLSRTTAQREIGKTWDPENWCVIKMTIDKPKAGR